MRAGWRQLGRGRWKQGVQRGDGCKEQASVNSRQRNERPGGEYRSMAADSTSKLPLGTPTGPLRAQPKPRITDVPHRIESRRQCPGGARLSHCAHARRALFPAAKRAAPPPCARRRPAPVVPASRDGRRNRNGIVTGRRARAASQRCTHVEGNAPPPGQGTAAPYERRRATQHPYRLTCIAGGSVMWSPVPCRASQGRC